MKLRILLFGLLMLLHTAAAMAQQLVVSVTDEEKQPVELAYVNIYTFEKTLLETTQTNETGVAAIMIKNYPVILEVVAPGYASYSQRLGEAPKVASFPVVIDKKFRSLNEVVITGVSQPQKLKDALSNYQVITKATMQAQGAVTLNDVMKNQLNVRVSDDAILGSSLGMQGMTGNKVKILVDGLPLNGRENGNINLTQVNLNNVERIEMIQGPMSVVYGTDALGGVINVITKNSNKPFSLNLGTYLETINKYNVDGAVSFKLADRHQVSLSGGRNFFEGFKNIDQSVVYHEDTLQTQRAFYFKPNEQYIANIGYRYTATSGFGLQFNSDYLNEKIINRGSLRIWDPFLGAYAFDEYYRTQRYVNRLSLTGKVGKKGTWQSQNGYFVYFRNRTRVNKDMVTLVETPTTGKGDQDTSRFNNIYLRGNYNNNFRKLRYTVGYDINLENARSNKINGKTKEIHDYALYTNLAMPLVADKLTAQVGLRGAYNTAYNPPLIPSFNILYTPINKLQVRGSYSQGYRAPSLKEMYLSFIDNNHNIVGNLDLVAEKSRHGQTSASYQLYEKQANYLQLIFTGYYNDVINGIVLVPVNPSDTNSIDYIYGNLKRQRNTIGSLQADGQWNDLHVVLGYAFNHTFESKGDYNAFSAQEATATVQYTWRKPQLGFNLFYKFTGPQPFLQPSIDGSATYNGRQSVFHVCDASVEKRLLDKKLHLIVGVKNVFDMQRLNTSGGAAAGAHGGGSSISFLPRSFFTSLRVNID